MSKRNREYCTLHDIIYLEYTAPIEKYRDNYTWLKFTIVRDLINSGFLEDGDILTHIDADMCIVNPNIEYPTIKSFNYSIDSGNTHCMGSYSIIVNSWSKNMIDLILDQSRFDIFKREYVYHERLKFNFNFWDLFREQASWYSLAGIMPHSDKSFWEIDNYGWHSKKTEHTIYSLQELEDNVYILPTEWNVTELVNESSCEFNINICDKDSVIIRHFAGGQPWRKEWFI
jgi:hypothetical protein